MLVERASNGQNTWRNMSGTTLEVRLTRKCLGRMENDVIDSGESGREWSRVEAKARLIKSVEMDVLAW